MFRGFRSLGFNPSLPLYHRCPSISGRVEIMQVVAHPSFSISATGLNLKNHRSSIREHLNITFPRSARSDHSSLLLSHDLSLLFPVQPHPLSPSRSRTGSTVLRPRRIRFQSSSTTVSATSHARTLYFCVSEKGRRTNRRETTLRENQSRLEAKGCQCEGNIPQ